MLIVIITLALLFFFVASLITGSWVEGFAATLMLAGIAGILGVLFLWRASGDRSQLPSVLVGIVVAAIPAYVGLYLSERAQRRY